MRYRSEGVAAFSGGLNIRDNSDQLAPGQAYDLLNVAFTSRGGVQSRPGYSGFGASTTLTAATTVSAATVTVVDTSSFDTAGTLSIGSDVVSYTGKTLTTFTGCSGITAVSAVGAFVGLVTPARADSLGAYYSGSAWQVVCGEGNRLEVRGTDGKIVSAAGASTTLTVASTLGAATVTVGSTRDFKSSGTILIGATSVTYTGKTLTTFTGCSGVIVASIGATITQVAASGTIATAPTANPHYFTRFGTSTAPYLYAANGTDSVKQWNGSEWTVPTWTGTAPTGKFLAVTPWDNRLVNACRSGSTDGDNKSAVRFSDPSVPTTWLSYNYIGLTTGDGESIMGMCSYGNYLFVFKQTKFFVFYGTAIAEDGTPEFSYRAVDTGVGLLANDLLAVGPDGVYFVDAKGVYRTNGGAPELVSDVIDPLFSNQVGYSYGGTAINTGSISAARMTIHNKQVMLAVPTGSSTTNDTILILDTRYGSWLRWNIKAAALLSVDVSGTGAGKSLVFGTTTGLNQLMKLAATAGNVYQDYGADIESYIKMGFTDFGVSENKTIREQQIWGVGSLRFATAKDLAGSRNAAVMTFGSISDRWGDGTGSDDWSDGTGTDLWSGGDSADVAVNRKAIRGTVFSVEVYSVATSPVPAWGVNKIINRVREQRVPSVLKTDR